MATGIGDLVVSLEMQNQQFLAALNTSGAKLDDFASQSEIGSSSIQRFGERGEEAGASASGAARSFGFLGRGIGEVGEKLGGTNTELGETVSVIGSTVSGLGEAVHGYHALHTAIEVASGAQMFLNSISPLGWATLAAGAVAAGYAYMNFSATSQATAEGEKKHAEDQKAASADVETAIKSLQREADKLEKTPLQQFQESLKHSALSASEAADAMERYARAAARAAGDKAQDAYDKDRTSAIGELASKKRDLDEEGMTAGHKFGLNFAAEHPDQPQERKDQATALGERMDQIELQKKTDQEREAQAKHLESTVSSLTEGPMDRLIAQARELQAGHAGGMIGDGKFQTAMAALQKQGEAAAKPEKEEPPKALEFGTAAAFEEIYKAQNPDTDHMERLADGQAKGNELLGVIAEALSEKAVFPR